MSFRRACLECGMLTEPGQSRCVRHSREHERKRSAQRNSRRGPTPVADSMRRRLNEIGAGQCALCHETFAAIQLEVDHRVPLWAGGRDEVLNIQPLCTPCHREKTRQENLTR